MRYINFVLLIAVFAVLVGCSTGAGPNDPGKEYMPDMGHSIAYEANYYDYYYYNTWGSEEDYYKMAQPRTPVNGTIPRGQVAGAQSLSDGIRIVENGSVPYYYGDTEEERTRATAEILENPYPITGEGLVRGKELYNIFCGVCHGEKGDGNGYLVSEDNPNAVYPAQPANFLSEEFINASPGRYYHSIMHGKNVMGNYRDKLSYEERWQVIHWIRSLQAKETKLVYNEAENTLNSWAQPGVLYAALNPPAVEETEMDHSDDHDGKDDHHEDTHSEHNH